jgi:uracil-DNA glycosylase
MSSSLKSKFGEGWYNLLEDMLTSPYFNQLGHFLESRRKSFNVEVYPAKEDVFKAFNLTPLEEVKVIILANSPYYKSNIATGLAFGVGEYSSIPDSLRIILKNVENEIYNGLNLHYDITLESWAKQGVLLLNTALTIEKGKLNTHIVEWELFTKEVLTKLQSIDNIIYVLWNVNDLFDSLITNPTSIVLTGEQVFSKINNQLLLINKTPIAW